MKNLIRFFIFLLVVFSSSVNSQVYNWFPVNSGTTNNLNCIIGFYIAGANGTLLASNNSGLSWYPVSSGTSNSLNSLAASGTTILAVGANGTILKSTNNGVNWYPVSSGVTNNLNGAARLSATNYCAAGSYGKIITSTNGGDNWSSQTSGVNTDLNSVSGFGFYVWAAGNNGTIIYSSNWGSSWVLQSSGTNVNLNYVNFQNNLSGWAVGDNGTILKTVNSGTNWISVNSGTNANLRTIKFPGVPAGWIAGDGGKVLSTTNNGLNWISENIGTTVDLNSLHPVNMNELFVVGKNGTIYNKRYDSLYTNWKIFTPNTTSTIISNTGLINDDIRTTNHPGFEWPAGSNKYAIFSTGLCAAAMVNGVLKEAMVSYKGEYIPGYIIDTLGGPMPKTDSRFRIYIVKRTDNPGTNQNWAQWGQMVPFGAPFVDVNHNNIYEPAIDTPGVSGASQTVFVCLTDGFPETHYIGEGFGGGTAPLFAEVHLLAWGYDNIPALNAVQYVRWDIINKSGQPWNSTYFSVVADPDLGGPNDDFIGCDTNLRLGYCYNGDNNDEGTYSYGVNPPAVGFLLLENAINRSVLPNVNLKMSSFTYFTNTSTPGPSCEKDPIGEPIGAYNLMKGIKKDETPWVIPPGGSSNFVTKFCFSGDPESGTGWNEGTPGNPSGSVWNCGGPTSYNGELHSPNQYGDRRLIISSGASNFTVAPNEKQTIVIAEIMAGGSNNLNSVTVLKTKAQTIRNNYLIGVNTYSENIPTGYSLSQNYPNPFNPSTKIHFSIPSNVKGEASNVKLVIYDILGKEIAVLVNDKLKPGEYEVEWPAPSGNGSYYASGIYFYKLITPDFSETKKMVLMK